jgi:hypothetical protein
MNQLMDLSGKKTANLKNEQNSLMIRMKSTSEVAVTVMELNIEYVLLKMNLKIMK